MKVGGIEPDAKWDYSLDGGKTWTPGNADAIGANDLDEGKNTIILRQTDKAGNVATATIEVTKDTQVEAPTCSTDGDTPGVINKNGSVTVGGIESDAKWDFSLNGGKTWTPGSGDRIGAGDLDEGMNALTIRQTDKAGNVATAMFDVVKDTQVNAPTVSIDSVVPGVVNKDGKVTVGGIEPGAKWDYSLDGGRTWTQGVGGTIPTAVLDEGDNSLHVRQTDQAGNVAADVVHVRKDTQIETLSATTSTGAAINNEGSVIVAGVEAGAHWEYSLDSGASWMPGYGRSISAGVFGGDGDKSVLVRQTDAAGNISAAASFTFTLDTTAPAAPSVSLVNDSGFSNVDKITRDATLNVAGLETGASWEYSQDDGATWVNGSDSFISASVLIGDGIKSILVRQTDVAGNTSAAASITFTLDTAAAAAPAVSLTNDSGFSHADQVTSDAALTISGLEAGTSWEYSLDNGVTWNTGSGSSIPARVFIGDGDKSVQVRQTDAAGNASAVSTFTFTLDTAAPAPPSVSLTNDSGSSNSDKVTSDAALSVSGLETGATWEYSADGSHWTIGSGSSIPASAFDGDGSKRIQVRQTDAAGNTSTASSVVFTLDTAAPAAPSVFLTSSNDTLTKDAALSVSGLETGAVWEYSLNGGTTWIFGSGSTIPASAFSGDGDKSVQVRQTDVAGNTSDASTFTFTLDTAAPAAPSVSLTHDSGSSNFDKVTKDASLSVSGLETGATWAYSLDSGTTWIDGSGSSIPASVFSGDGEKSVQVRQTDPTGNTSAVASFTFTLDTAAPAAPSMSLTNDAGSSNSDKVTKDATLSISGLETGATWEYSSDGSRWT
ncbi:hypothetical protein CDN99_10675, partial [Roseateles aquatilis]